MYRVLCLRNVCVAIVVMCLSFSGSRSSGEDPSLGHPVDRDRKGGYSPRIAGGEEVPPHTYPFQVALTSSDDEFCGGTLISANLVLTAAHCVKNEPDYVTVVLGEHERRSKRPNAVKIRTKDYIIHKGYNSSKRINDIGLVYLPTPVTFSKNIQPVKLATGNNTYEGAQATIVGWGNTETSRFSSVLKRVNDTIISIEDCGNKHPGFKWFLKPTHMCTSGTGNVGLCGGDSGGPLLVDGIQVGINSLSTFNCTLGLPSVYTRVSSYSDWIEQGTDFYKYYGHASTLSGQFEVVALVALISSYFFN